MLRTCGAGRRQRATLQACCTWTTRPTHAALHTPPTHHTNMPVPGCRLQVLMTRAMRERQRGPLPPAPTHAVVKVRLPEGICVQVCALFSSASAAPGSCLRGVRPAHVGRARRCLPRASQHGRQWQPITWMAAASLLRCLAPAHPRRPSRQAPSPSLGPAAQHLQRPQCPASNRFRCCAFPVPCHGPRRASSTPASRWPRCLAGCPTRCATPAAPTSWCCPRARRWRRRGSRCGRRTCCRG